MESQFFDFRQQPCLHISKADTIVLDLRLLRFRQMVMLLDVRRDLT
jgi:hypothetical protein